jgi:hypothetical protein
MFAAQAQADDRRWNQATVVMLALVVVLTGLFTVG